MKRDFAESARCPACRDKLELRAESTSDVVERGAFFCARCGVEYPIIDGLPDLIRHDLHPAKVDLTDDTAGINRANREYHDRHAKTYETDAHTNHMFEGACQERIAEVVAWAASKTPAQRSLDIGCGTGNVIRKASAKFERAFGVDLSPGMMELMKDVKADVALASGTALPFEDGFFDFVSVFSVLHHLFDPREAIREAYRVLRKGGVFYSDWDFNDRFRTRILFSMWIHDFNPIRAAKGFIEHFLLKDDENKIFTMAEYHAFKDWLDAEGLARFARETGYSKVNLVYHWNAASVIDSSGEPFQPTPRGFDALVTMSKNPRVAFPIFSIIAVK